MIVMDGAQEIHIVAFTEVRHLHNLSKKTALALVEPIPLSPPLYHEKNLTKQYVNLSNDTMILKMSNIPACGQCSWDLSVGSWDYKFCKWMAFKKYV